LESLGRILSGDTALDSETTLGNGFLGKTKLRKSCTSSYLNLSSNDIDASDFLWGKCQ